MKIKYVIFDKSYSVLVSEAVGHNEIRLSGRYADMKPTSAGFCTITQENEETIVNCFGESISLDLKCDKENDERIIKKIFNYYY